MVELFVSPKLIDLSRMLFRIDRLEERRSNALLKRKASDSEGKVVEWD